MSVRDHSEILADEIKTTKQNIENYPDIILRDNEKALNKTLDSLNEEKINIEYDWKEFIPSLGFVTETSYTDLNPNVDSTIRAILKKQKSDEQCC